MENLKIIKDPLIVAYSNKLMFFYWLTFTIFSGQLGIILNVIIKYYSSDTNPFDSLVFEYSNGNFFTFSIALIASMLGMLFIKLVNESNDNFKKLKITTSIIVIFTLLFGASIYSATQISQDNKKSSILATQPQATQPQATQPEVTQPQATQPEVTQPQATQPQATQPQATQPQATQPQATQPQATHGITQLIFYIFAIIISIYIYGILELRLPDHEYLSDNYKKEEDEIVEETIVMGSQRSNDGEGLNL